MATMDPFIENTPAPKSPPTSVVTSPPGTLQDAPAQILEEHDTFILDCDGVIWHGDHLIPGAAEAIKHLKSLNKKVLFVTNNNARGRADLLLKFERLGLADGVTVDDIVTGASAMGLYLTTQAPHVKKAYMIGSTAMKKELECAGVEVLGGGIGSDGRGAAQYVGEAMTEAAFMELDVKGDGIEAVVCGGDFSVNYAQICRASLYLQLNPEMPFLVASMDAFDQHHDRRFPGPTGMTGRALRSITGLEPTVTGKPSQTLARAVIKAHNLDPMRTVMVGDRLSSDIMFGNGAGFSTLLVMTGTTKSALLETREKEQHDLVACGKALVDDWPEWKPKFMLDSLGCLTSA